jgi:SHS2 domain-containing protein
VTRLGAPALDLLLVEWLEELLFRLDAHGELWCQHEVRVVEGRSGRYLLAAISRGEPFDPARHPQKVQIKAVTYHALEVARDPGGWRARVLFDI